MRALLIKIAALSVIVGFYGGCSPVKFSLDDSKCKESGCIVENGKYRFDYSATAGYGKVDILIVNDNSASMSFEQNRLVPRFKNFIQDLDNKKIDYRIAMTTTDVVSGTGGKLVPFKDGLHFITSKDADRYNLFAQLQRKETLNCEAFIANWIRQHNGDRESIGLPQYMVEYNKNCPSGDERGVYAANLVIQSNPSDFIRQDAHLAVIFLSDEDVRSGLYSEQGAYPLERMDQPNYFVNSVKAKYGDEKYRSLSVHAIVVKDQKCLDEQNSQVLNLYPPTKGIVVGSFGNVYLSFVNNGWGLAANICSDDYPGQLGQIRTVITEKIKDIMLSCSDPSDLIVTVSGTPVSHTVEGKTLKFVNYLAPGTQINLSYTCSSLN